LLASSEQLVDFGITLSVITDYTQPFIDQMAGLAGSIESMGDNPFAPFGTLETHSESMTTFATSAEQLTKALDAIDGEYVGDQFYAIGDSIQYMVEQLDELNMGDMVKLGAMKMFGPSKEEKEEVEQKEAVKEIAWEKLHGGFENKSGLIDLMNKFTMIEGASAFDPKHDPSYQMQTHLPSLGAAGINVDTEALRGEKGYAALNKEMTSITNQLQKQIDMYSMAFETGKLNTSPNAVPTEQAKQQVDAYNMQAQTGIDQNAVPTVGQQPQIEEDSTNTGSAQNTLAEFKPESQSMEAELDTPTLLAELVRLQTENNRLLKKEVDAINSLDV